ncbi:MAG: acylphosphatase [Thermodesulfobacteriota bacterium]|nr:acylphosphatase [Thermodesulfobacteriota bacterium]
MSEYTGASIVISGKVQGVFFRADTQKAARRYGVSGWVCNRPDGTVEALMEGLRKDVEALIAWCNEGSPMSRVDRVDVKWKMHTGKFPRFEITF